MAKKGNKALKQRPRRGEAAVPQTCSERLGRPSRKAWIWNDEQRDRFVNELRDIYPKLRYTDVTQIVTEFANELSDEMSSITRRQKPKGIGSVERAVRYAIAHRSGRRALPASYVIPTIEYLGLEEESVAFLFPHLPRDRTVLVKQGDNRGQSSWDVAVLATGKLAAGDTQSDAAVTLRSPTKTLATREDTPQWADFEEFPLNGRRLRQFRCVVSTRCEYFRFGFKLLADNGKLFGDGSIQSQDANLVVHIGRNNWDRRGITAHDVFLTSYRNGVREKRDKKVLESPKSFTASVALAIDESAVVRFCVDDRCHYQRAVPMEICHRIVMLGWGDQEDFALKVSDIAFTTAK